MKGKVYKELKLSDSFLKISLLRSVEVVRVLPGFERKKLGGVVSGVQIADVKSWKPRVVGSKSNGWEGSWKEVMEYVRAFLNGKKRNYVWIYGVYVDDEGWTQFQRVFKVKRVKWRKEGEKWVAEEVEEWDELDEAFKKWLEENGRDVFRYAW